MKTLLLAVLFALSLGWLTCSSNADDYRRGYDRRRDYDWRNRWDWRRHQNDWRVYYHRGNRFVWVDDHYVWQRTRRGLVLVFVPGHYEMVR